jgi:glycine betaine/proline transport system substrate-binding protein
MTTIAKRARTGAGAASRTGRTLVALLLALTLLATACGSDATTTEAADGDQGASAGGVEKGSLETIALAANPWNGSRLNVAVAAQLLESELGYKAEITELDENAQWAAINAGDLNASLEIWPSGHAKNVVDFIDNPDGRVENIGLLGPVGKIGWYVPTYVIKDHPELATSEGFADPELAKLFATAETGDKGQFLAGDPSFVQYDESIITNLDLPLQVVSAGSEEALLAALDSAYSRQEPILLYLWTPHSALNAYDLTEVKLPAYSEDCYASAATDGADIACDYPPDELFKIANKDLAEQAPAAYTLIKNMSYTTKDQIEMLAAVETDGLTVEEAAAQWITDHPDVWKTWLP